MCVTCGPGSTNPSSFSPLEHQQYPLHVFLSGAYSDPHPDQLGPPVASLEPGQSHSKNQCYLPIWTCAQALPPSAAVPAERFRKAKKDTLSIRRDLSTCANEEMKSVMYHRARGLESAFATSAVRTPASRSQLRSAQLTSPSISSSSDEILSAPSRTPQ